MHSLMKIQIKKTKFSNGELTLYSDDGAEFILDFTDDVDMLLLAVMLKSVGFKIDSDSSYKVYTPETLKLILQGKVNPFISSKESEKNNGVKL